MTATWHRASFWGAEMIVAMAARPVRDCTKPLSHALQSVNCVVWGSSLKAVI